MGYFNIYGQYVQDDSELYHHGILGMRWGKKNGPPYPLRPGDHSASEKKAGWRKSLDGNSDTSKSKIKNYTRQAKENTKALNKKAQKYSELDYAINTAYGVKTEIDDKIRKRSGNISSKKLSKLNDKKDALSSRIESLLEDHAKVESDIRSAIAKMKKEGYDVTSKLVRSDFSREQYAVYKILKGDVGNFTLTFSASMNKDAIGSTHKFKVSANKLKEAERARADAINDVSAKLGISPSNIDTGATANAKMDNSYYRRNPNEANSLQTNFIKKKGGIKVSSTYDEAYSKAYDDALNKASKLEFKGTVNKQKLIDNARKSKPSFRTESTQPQTDYQKRFDRFEKLSDKDKKAFITKDMNNDMDGLMSLAKKHNIPVSKKEQIHDVVTSSPSYARALQRSGMTYKEIAKKIGISESSVYSLLNG